MKKEIVTRTVKIPQELAKNLNALAKKEDRSESSVIRLALSSFFLKNGNTKNTPKYAKAESATLTPTARSK